MCGVGRVRTRLVERVALFSKHGVNVLRWVAVGVCVTPLLLLLLPRLLLLLVLLSGAGVCAAP
jgi:hypothetical protein